MGNILLTRPAARRRGSALLYVAIIMAGLIMVMSLGVDMGRAQLAKTELYRACDASARYGAAGLSQGVTATQTRVTTAAADNLVDGIPLVIDPTTDLDFGVWDPAT